jgi:endonuclease YncB( thermonuclease family)
MVADGFAWHYVEYSKDAGLAAAERDARTAGLGL